MSLLRLFAKRMAVLIEDFMILLLADIAVTIHKLHVNEMHYVFTFYFLTPAFTRG
jgi:hypothetical protein